jgi:hypothetical protein
MGGTKSMNEITIIINDVIMTITYIVIITSSEFSTFFEADFQVFCVSTGVVVHYCFGISKSLQ